MEILIIRHGETVWNKIHRFQGRTDIELTEYGRELARITGEALKDIPVDHIFASPLCRAVETANLIRGERNIPLTTDDRLVEMCFGTMEGENTEEVLHDEKNPFHFLFSEPQNFKPAPGGETFEEVCARAADFLKTEVEPFEEKYGRIIIVGHGACNRALLCHILKRGIPDFWGGGYQGNCAVTTVSLENGRYRMIEDAKLYY